MFSTQLPLNCAKNGAASLANGNTSCIGKAADEGSESGTWVIAAVKLVGDREHVEGDGVDGVRIARTVYWFVSPTFSSLRLSLLKVAKPAHQQRILMSLRPRWLIYPMA